MRIIDSDKVFACGWIHACSCQSLLITSLPALQVVPVEGVLHAQGLENIGFQGNRME